MVSSFLDLVVSHVRRRLIQISLFPLTGALCLAQDLEEVSKLSVARGEGRKYFGSAVSIDRSMEMEAGELRVLVGAPTRGGSGRGGSAHLFRLSGADWVHEKELTREGAGVDEGFGSAVALYGETALVAAPKTQEVYVYRLAGTDWVQDAVLSPGSGQWRRCSVSIWEQVALIGARGRAYAFRRTGTGWTEEAELGPSGRGGWQFGHSVSLYGRTALIGAPEGADLFPGKGRAYIFRYTGSQWTKEKVLRAPDGNCGDNFGGSVSLSRDVCLIGAKYHGACQAQPMGAAYIFRYDGNDWALERKLRPTLATPADDVYVFGDSTSIDGDHAIVGSPYFGDRNRGAAQIYERRRGEWNEVRRFPVNDLQPYDHFGESVAMGRGYAATGTPNNDCNGACYGAVHLLRLCNGSSQKGD